MVKGHRSQYIELYGSEAGKAVEYFSKISEELNDHLDNCSEYGEKPIIFPDDLLSFKTSTSRPALNSHIGDKI